MESTSAGDDTDERPLIEFLRLQAGLLDRFTSEAEITDEVDNAEVVTRLRRASGLRLTLDGESWTCRSHGIGVCFTSENRGLKVDVSCRLSDPRYFDKWRLHTYFGSMGRAGTKTLQRIAKRPGTHADMIEAWIGLLREAGSIVVDGAGFRLS